MSAWPHTGIPDAGPLSERDLNRACMFKTPVVLTKAMTEGADSVADWAQPPAPAEACTELGANVEHVLIVSRRKWFIALTSCGVALLVAGLCYV